jgi:site-specific DNA recombinase
MNAAIYARYSSDQQSPASLDDQIRKCTEYATTQGWRVEHIFTDAEVSGAGRDRPGLRAMLDAIPSFNALLLDDTSRLSRRLADSVDIFEHLRFAGVRIVAVSQGIDSNSEQADVLMTVHGLVDSLYIKELGKKTHRGLEGRALKGLHTGGRIFGYSNVPCETGGVQLQINEAEADVVRRLFRLYAEGYSYKRITTILNEEHIPSPRPRAGRRSGWCFTGVRAMLRNELYIGNLIWNRARFVKKPGTNHRSRRERPREEWKIFEREDLRIIDADLWNRVQQRAETIKTLFRKPGVGSNHTGGPHLLSGFLRCGVCGSNMIIIRGPSKNRDRKYGCGDHYTRGNCANGTMIEKDLIERRLFAEIQEQVLKPELVTYVVRSLAMPEADDNRKRLAAIELELSRLAEAVAATGPSPALLAAIREREQERRTLATRKPASAPVDLGKWALDALSDIRALLAGDSARARAKLARHASPVILLPTDNGYVVEGKWNVLGSPEYFAGGGFEPPTFGL